MIVLMPTIAKTNGWIFAAKEKPRAVPKRQLTGAVLFGPAQRNRTSIHGLEDHCTIHCTNARNFYLTDLALARIMGSMSFFIITLVQESVKPEAWSVTLLSGSWQVLMRSVPACQRGVSSWKCAITRLRHTLRAAARLSSRLRLLVPLAEIPVGSWIQRQQFCFLFLCWPPPPVLENHSNLNSFSLSVIIVNLSIFVLIAMLC